MRRLLKWTAGAVAVLMLLGLAAFAWFVWWPVHSIPPLERVDQYAWLDQGWGTAQNDVLRQRYYYTPQGTSMPQGASEGAVRYSWFVNLELPLSDERFAAPDHMRQWRFIVDPAPSAANPDQLPIGFTRHFDAHIGEDVLDITCAACHTGEIHFKKDGRNTAVRIDGGPAMHAFTDMQRGNFAPVLLASLIDTSLKPWKFNRFARRVLGSKYPEGKGKLWTSVVRSVFAMLGTRQNLPWKKLYPVQEGFGRTDALGRIGNTAFGDHLSSSNYQVGAAPVSYPYVWNIWKFDWVQYNGSVAQPLARNVGEALGVGAIAPLLRDGKPLPPGERFRSSVDIGGLQRIEHALQLLRPPRWPENLFGAIDQAKAERGRELFEQHCRECHGPYIATAARQQSSAPLKSSHELEWRIETIPVEHIGTDPAAADGFMDRRYDLSATGLSNADLENALRPLLVRSLLRDVRFRLTEVIRLRAESGAETGDLPAALAAYPDPDAQLNPEIPQQPFAAIDAALVRLIPNLPGIPDATTEPPDPPICDLGCNLRWLHWDVQVGGKNIEHTLAGLEVTKLSEGLALNLVGIIIKNRYYADNKIDYATQQCLEGFGTLDLPRNIRGYKPRPLEGVWATAPYLHNGSVPTLYQMLLPPGKRDKKFFVGRRDFDPVNVGLATQPDADGSDDGFWLDTSTPGNHNTGHAFSADAATWAKHVADRTPLPPGVIGPEFTDQQRYDLIEYLKVHRDPETPANYQPPSCHLAGGDL